MPVVELRYQGYVVGRLDCGCAFEPANEDDLWVHVAILERLAA